MTDMIDKAKEIVKEKGDRRTTSVTVAAALSAIMLASKTDG